jgi:hypothetical protein
MLDLIDAVFVGGAMAVILVVAATVLARQLSSRVALAAAGGVWIGAAAATAASGVFGTARGPLAILVFFGGPLALTAGAALFIPTVRATLLATPMPLLIGVNVIRVLGVMFLVLAAAGRLAGPFPYSAGWGDIVTGALALPLAWLATRDPAAHRGAIWAWNTFGTLDLLVAVTLGMLSQNGSPLHLIHAGVGTAAMTELPWSMVPTFLVPIFLISHGIIFAQLRSQASRRRSSTLTDPRLAVSVSGV